jgi:hypothetical protein
MRAQLLALFVRIVVEVFSICTFCLGDALAT